MRLRCVVDFGLVASERGRGAARKRLPVMVLAARFAVAELTPVLAAETLTRAFAALDLRDPSPLFAALDLRDSSSSTPARAKETRLVSVPVA